jgi:hypothetical protein
MSFILGFIFSLKVDLGSWADVDELHFGILFFSLKVDVGSRADVNELHFGNYFFPLRSIWDHGLM